MRKNEEWNSSLTEQTNELLSFFGAFSIFANLRKNQEINLNSMLWQIQVM